MGESSPKLRPVATRGCGAEHCVLVPAREICHALAVEKKRIRQMQAIAEKLRAMPDLSDDERLLYAHSLVLTPDERWERNLQYIQSVRSCVLLPRKKSHSSL